MGCGCGGARKYDAITSAEANALIEQQRLQDQTPENYYESMLASAGAAIGNANSEETAQR